MNSNNVEFATYSIFTLFLCPLWAKVPVPMSGLYTASAQANESSQFHTVIPSFSRPTCSIYLLSQLKMPRLPWAIHSLTPREKAEFKVGNPWTMAWALPICREKGFGYFLFHSKKIYGWSSYNKCWVRVINLSKPTSRWWLIQTYLVHKSHSTKALCFPSSLAIILNPWGCSFTNP